MLILLMIGKIIGIVLLIIAIVIAVILLVPMRYRLVAKSEEKCADFKLKWLLGLVSFTAGYREEFHYKLRVAGIPILPKKKKKEEQETIEADDEKAEKKKKKASVWERVKRIAGIVKAFIEEGVLSAVMPILQTFLVRIRPRELSGKVAFGFENPATTGELCGGLSAIPFIFATDLQFYPDFDTEESYFDGCVKARGHIFIVHVLLFLLALFRKKEVRRFIHVIQQNKKKSKKK
ncbi:MAG: DUF2953 domain-containing protein [Lachnospiraceae bacterium]|nr:DUF2953 domain-containing protein [Lachnospiraceae bacterium]